MQLTSRVVAKVDKYALLHNYNKVKSLARSSKVLAMVKGNGYGHGIVNIASSLPQADGFAVATLQEAFVLREYGIKQPIALTSGFINKEELLCVEKLGLDVFLHAPEQVRILEQSDLSSDIRVWLYVDTGMHKLGFHPSEVAELYSRLSALPFVKSSIHLMTHFACADYDSAKTNKQIEVFEGATSGYDCPKSMANSAAIIDYPLTHKDWVRPGIMLYGVSPKSGVTGQQLGLEPVMRLSSFLISIKNIKKGESVGYHSLWTAPKDSTIGIVSIGYGDGYPWSAPNGTPFWLNGHICPTVGRVSMDYIAIDLSAVSSPVVGSEVVIWGPELPVERVASIVGLSPYYLVTSVGSRSSHYTSENNIFEKQS